MPYVQATPRSTRSSRKGSRSWLSTEPSRLRCFGARVAVSGSAKRPLPDSDTHAGIDSPPDAVGGLGADAGSRPAAEEGSAAATVEASAAAPQTVAAAA